MTTREDFETRFALMGRDIDDMVSDDREEYLEERRALKEKWDKLEVRRTEMETKGENAWEEFKDEMEAGWEDIRITFEDLRNRLAR